MKCPECGNECRKGNIEAKDGSISQLLTMLQWYPEYEKDKLIRKGTISLSLYGDGYYCDECMKVFASFSEN